MPEKSYRCVKCNQPMKVADFTPPATVRCGRCKQAMVVPGDAPLIGRVIAGHHILRKIGGGGMGTVYLATQLSLSRKVAFKSLSPKNLKDAEALQQFKTEAVSAARMSHPNIVQVYDVGMEEGIPYLTMEFVNGVSMKQLIKSGSLSIPVIVDVGKQVLAALARAQREHVVHRDIKPENILIDHDGMAKVADFGLAAILREGQADDVRRGTPFYMSPEHVRGESVDHRADIYSVGATLYHALAGRPPFDGTPRQVLDAVVSQEALPASAHNPAVTESISAVVARMMAKDRDARFQSAEEALEALEHVDLGGDPLGAELQAFATPEWEDVFQDAVDDTFGTEGLPPRSDTKRRRRSSSVGIVLGVVGVTVLLGAGAVLCVFLMRKPPEPVTPGGGTGPVVVHRVDPVLEAQAEALLARAADYAVKHQTDYAGIEAAYVQVVAKAPGTEAAKEAKRRALKVRAFLDGKGNALLEEMKGKAKALADEDRYADALEVFSDFPPEFLDTSRTKALNEAESSLRKAGEERAAALSKKGAEAVENADWDVAKTAYENLGKIGFHTTTVESEDWLNRIVTLRKYWAEERRLTASVGYITLARKCVQHTAKRAYDKALAECDAALEDADLAAEAEKIQREKAQIEKAREFFKFALKELTDHPGTPIRIENKVGLFQGLRDGKVVVKSGSAETLIEPEMVDTNALVRAAGKSLNMLEGGSHLRLANFYIYENQYDLARQELGKAERMDADVDAFMKRRVELLERRETEVSYDQVLEGLAGTFAMKSGDPIDGQPNFVSEAANASLQLIGDRKDISVATLSIAWPKDKPQTRERNARLLGRFLQNILPTWGEGKAWVLGVVERYRSDPDAPGTKRVRDRSAEVMYFEELDVPTIFVTVRRRRTGQEESAELMLYRVRMAFVKREYAEAKQLLTTLRAQYADTDIWQQNQEEIVVMNRELYPKVGEAWVEED